MKSKSFFLGWLFFICIILVISNYWFRLQSTKPENKIRIVLSLTTSPTRINKMKPLIDCLKAQTLQPDQIYLNLPRVFLRDNTTFGPIPDFIKEYELIKINWVRDIGPSTKILSSIPLENNLETIFVSIDDDIYYPPYFLATYIFWARKFPDSVITGTTFMPIDDPFLKKDYYPLTPCQLLEGFSGVVYRKKFLIDFNMKDLLIGPKECRLGDDFILSNHIMKKNIPILALTKKNIVVQQIYPLDYGLEKDGLHKQQNMVSLGNRRNYQICSRYLDSKNQLYIDYYLKDDTDQLKDN